jgi:hypothetical protein
LMVASLIVLVLAWAIANFVSGGAGFATLVSDELQGGEEAASAMARLFAALVLVLFLVEDEGWRLCAG